MGDAMSGTRSYQGPGRRRPRPKSRPENADERLYSVRDIAKTFNLSRRTLLYYESLGIVEPARNERTGYRSYATSDIFRLMSAILLKNLGTPARGLPCALSQQPFTAASFDQCSQQIQQRIAYCQAQQECLDKLRSLVKKTGLLEEAFIEPYYFVHDNAELGYHDFSADKNLAGLIQHLPIGGLGSISCASRSSCSAACGVQPSGVVAQDTQQRWGRTVAVRHASLIPLVSTEQLMRVGGCHCVCSYEFVRDIVGREPYAPELKRAYAYMQEHSLRPAGLPFTPYSLPSEHGFYSVVCYPVEDAVNPAGRCATF